MISSEVQRTLVKSPPELWAELSDPDSLGRHLGELGEIKITRVEPEKLVEWEATGITGKVAIKASGWGTRVTLTVEREVAEPAAENDAVEETEEPAEGEAAAAAEIAASEKPDAVVATEPEPAIAPEPEISAASEPAIAQEPEALVESEPPVEQEPAETLAADGHDERTGSDELRPAPATEAARRAAGLQPPEPAEETPTELAAKSSAPEPRRRGFFARLFGARRKRPDAETDGLPATAEPSTTTVAAPPAEELPEAEAPLEDAPEPAAEEAPETATTAETETAPTDAETDVETDVEAEAANDQDAHEPETAQVDDEVAHDAQADAEEPAATAAPETDAEPESAKDLAAELAAAEESATADVTAILTGVLDRLGAAHHRPFSRA